MFALRPAEASSRRPRIPRPVRLSNLLTFQPANVLTVFRYNLSPLFSHSSALFSLSRRSISFTTCLFSGAYALFARRQGGGLWKTSASDEARCLRPGVAGYSHGAGNAQSRRATRRGTSLPIRRGPLGSQRDLCVLCVSAVDSPQVTGHRTRGTENGPRPPATPLRAARVRSTEQPRRPSAGS